MAGIADKMKQAGVEARQKRTEPLWKGPAEDGITQSLLSRFLVCRERFRLRVVEGLRAEGGWDHKTGYGDMWHCCEESLAANKDWRVGLLLYSKQLVKEHPTQITAIDKWYEVCKAQFPIYVDWWAKHPDVKDRTPIAQEQEFAVDYKLPSGRVVKLRGKRDAVDLIGKGKGSGIWLQENKTKGDIREDRMKRQLTFDLQTMLYLVAMYEEQEDYPAPILGVRYNVIRRPLSGGKGSIKQHEATKGAKCPKCKGAGGRVPGIKCVNCNGSGRVNAQPAETKEAFYQRVAQYIKDEPETYFMRWQVRIFPHDIQRFRYEFLDPVLEGLCDWWEYINDHQGGPFKNPERSQGLHWRHPFGVYNVLDEGGSSDLDEYLMTGSEVGLKRVDNLFPELTGGK